MKQVVPISIQSGLSQSESYILMLAEPESGTRIPIFIGQYEAQSILIAKEGVVTRRPLTHELMKHLMDAYGLGLKSVSIDRVVEGIFYATLHMSDGFSEKEFDSRTSDAIALALLCQCPIMVDEKVIEETGVAPDPSKQAPRSIEELEEELRRCEECEDYERAAEIQQMINSQKKR